MKIDVKFPKTSCNRFFKVIRSGDQTEMLIPPAICKKLKRIELRKKAILTSSEGSWSVKIEKCKKGSSFYFKEGWGTFGKHHKLSIGDIVVFEYEKNFHFNVFVFDGTSCEKEFPRNKKKKKNNETIKRRMSAGKPPVVGIKPPEVAEASSACKNPHFIGTVKEQSDGRKTYMHIPRNFVVSNDFSEVKCVNLRVGRKKIWPVKLYSLKRVGHIVTSMCGGWATFCDAHELEEGDVCLFELDSSYTQSTSSEENAVIMDVIIFSSSV